MDSTKIIFDCPLPPWLVGAAALAVLVTVIVFVGRDAAHLGRWRRRIILAGAVVATVMLAGLALSPKIIRRWEDPTKPICCVLVDGSRSMLFSDKYEGEQARWLAGLTSAPAEPEQLELSRAEVVQALLRPREQGWLASVAEQFDVSCWRFSSQLEPLPLKGAESAYQVDPEGYATAIGRAMEDSSARTGTARLQAMVVLSDGAWNAGPDPSEVSRTLGRLGIPVYVVGLGTLEPPREAAVLSVRAPKTALLGDKLFVRAEIAGTGLGAKRLPVQLESEGEVIEEKQIPILPTGRPVNVSFSFVPTRPGRRLLKVRIPQQAGEQDESNNSATCWVEIEERKINVLLVDSEPRWEFRFIRNVFERDPAVSLTTCLLRPQVGPIVGEGYLKDLPEDKKDLAKYDLVVLGDVGRDKLPDAFLKELAEMVRQRGVALIISAGRRNHYRELAGTEISAILPVSLEGGTEGSAVAGQTFHLELTQQGASHLMTRLAEDQEENELSWSQLPKANWSASVGGLSRGATALLVHPYRIAGTAKLPLLAVQRVGRGKVMFCGLDETWRWRKAVGDQYHYRFWAQAVRWMAKQPFSQGDQRCLLSIERNQCDVGEKIEVEAYCLDPDGFPLENSQVRLRIEDEQGAVEHLVMQPATDGWGIYRCTFTAGKPSKYTMQPIVDVYGDEPLDSAVVLEAWRVDLERNYWAQDRNSLLAMAQASSGEYLEISGVDRLGELLGAKKSKRFLTAEYPLCGHWAYYVLLAGVLAMTWLVRKRSGLA